MFELIENVKDLIQAIRDRDYPAILEEAGSVLQEAATLWKQLAEHQVFAAASPVQAEQLAACCGDLEACHAELTAPRAAGADAAGLDPASIALIIQGVLAILRFIRDRRHPQPDPTPDR